MSFLSCLLKTIFCPCILIFYAFKIYVFGCCQVYFERGCRGIFCGLCVCCNCTYKDRKFPPTAQSIGPWNGKSLTQVDSEVEWQRVKKVFARNGTEGERLFGDKIQPADICQGQVGDCWLMSAIACLAQVPGAIQRNFVIREYTHYGRYKIRLFDKGKGWVTVPVDDWIPCRKGTTQPLFAKPSGDAAWVLLLEKAMAKHYGSYAALDGGSTLWAFECLTGNYVFKFKLDGSNPEKKLWHRFDLVHVKGQRGKVLLQPTDDNLRNDEMFATVLFYTKKKSVVAASSGGDGNDTQSINGIVQGHAYSVIAAVEVSESGHVFKMVQVRNPWGTFEWSGDFSDRSTSWQKYPKVAKACDFKPSDNGTFWMEWVDFQHHFKNLDFCFRTTGWDDLVLNIHEESPCIGPCVGCVGGCADYWCCCKGMWALACGNEKQAFQRAPTGCCATTCVC